MDNKSSEDFFNGIDASRFDFTNHRAYVSVEFSNISHNIYLQLRHSERVEAPVVGGFAVRVYKPGLLAPYIAFAIAIVAIRIGAVYAKKRWTRKFAVQRPKHCKERKS